MHHGGTSGLDHSDVPQAPLPSSHARLDTMATSIAAPVPQSHPRSHPTRKDFANIQMHEDGRGTPLPQYEKTQSVPFTLTLQEEKENPGQFQLVVNVDPQHQKPPTNGRALRPAASKKLIANLKEVPEVPSLGYDVSPLYQTQKSSPPSSPQEERQGWSELDAIPPEFLQKVVPDWKVTFSRSDSTASSQSRRLADIKARIKKSGKGFVVRLLKGSSAGNNEVAEVHLGQQNQSVELVSQELDSEPRVELDATEAVTSHLNDQAGTTEALNTVFEIGTSSEPGIERTVASPAPAASSPSVSDWLNNLTAQTSRRTSVLEEGLSDAETLIPDIRSIADRLEDRMDLELFSRPDSVLPTRSNSVFSIVKTPTRGLSVVGPTKRADKVNRIRTKGKAARSDLNRSGAQKSIKRHSPRTTSSVAPIATFPPQSTHRPSGSRDLPFLCPKDHSESSDDHEANIWEELQQTARTKGKRRASANELSQMVKPKPRDRLHPLDTNVSRPASANTSPVSRRKRSPRSKKAGSSSSSINLLEKSQQTDASPIWAEVDPSDELREALTKALSVEPDEASPVGTHEQRPIPRIEESVCEGDVGDFSLPAEVELRPPPPQSRSPMTTFWGLAFDALAGRLVEGIQALRGRYGSEPPVPPNHVRVRWTCSCGELLYDDFIERRPGAARMLEAFLNRPRAHIFSSPSDNPRTHAPRSSPDSRTSTSTSMSSIFDSVSKASTLATPASTYGGPSSWTRNSDSKHSPTYLRSNSSFNVRIAEESWLLTCANEGRFTPKIVHLDVNEGRIRSDKDLALALREHYERLNRRWLKWARLRGLTTIEFVQFEVHRNRFADIRATPSMPPNTSSISEKSPSQHPYTFESVDLMPPVGSAYLLHLFKHPEDYDGELITYLRAPKRRQRLETGMGWGINLVEGFLAQKVWAVLMICFGVGSGVFGVIWTIKQGDVQGAFGVAGWVVTLAGLVLGGLQAWLE